MKTATLKTKSVPLTDAKAHFAEYVRAVENGVPSISITRHGKVVAKLVGLEQTDKPRKTLADSMGALRGTAVFSTDYDPHAPAFSDDEWEMND